MDYQYYEKSTLKKQTFYLYELYVGKIIKTKICDGEVKCDTQRIGIFKNLDNHNYLHVSSGIIFQKLTSDAENCEYYVLQDSLNCLDEQEMLKDYDSISFEAIERLEDKLNKKYFENETNKNNEELNK